MGIDQAKIDATWDPRDPIFTERERAALEMATLFTEDYRAIGDQHIERWKDHFSDEELIELGAFMAFADGFGKLVEMLGLGQADQTCRYEV
jgi:alkylhydroperoxidase family enzyme